MKKSILGFGFSMILLLTTISMPAGAASIWHSGKLKIVYPAGNGEVILTFDTNAPTCTNASHYMYMRVGQNSMTQDGLENMLSVLLTAAASGRSVSVNFDDATTGCYVNRLYVNFFSP